MMYLNAKRFEFKCTVDLKCRRQYQPVSFLLDDKRCRVSTALVNRSFALHSYLNVTDGCRVLEKQHENKVQFLGKKKEEAFKHFLWCSQTH